MKGTVCATSFPESSNQALPMMDVRVNGKYVRALIDTGSSQSILSRRLVSEYTTGSGCVFGVSGHAERIVGNAKVDVDIGSKRLRVNCLILNEIIEGIDFIVGMDVIAEMGGVSIKEGEVQFPSEDLSLSAHSDEEAESDLIIHDKDFVATFNGEFWSVKWNWSSSEEPELSQQVSSYPIASEHREKFDLEINEWIDKGWLVPAGPQDKAKAVIPLMAVYHPLKDKVRPVLDYRNLNSYISSHTGQSAVCQETLRKWRQIKGSIVMLDLEKAYLQIRMENELWPYQGVRYKGQLFFLTRLGFGLCSAPRIMTTILQRVLSLDDKIKEATDSYIDDIIVNTDVCSAEKVIEHLNRFGLKSKPPEILDGARVLGLKVKQTRDGYRWERSKVIPGVNPPFTKREVFSLCGSLTAHYPIANWLRVACSFLKRESSSGHWDENVSKDVEDMVLDLLEKLKNSDPVGGFWNVECCKHGTVWCDASSLATAAVLEIGDKLVEDASWLRKKNDANHINVAELESVLKGVNMAANWGISNLKIMTDSATVYSWLRSTFDDTERVKMHGMSEILVKRRLCLLKEIRDEVFENVYVELIPSQKNKADALTRVEKKWMRRHQTCLVARTQNKNVPQDELRKIHDKCHFGVDRTLYLAQCVYPQVTKDAIIETVRNCQICSSIDPTPVRFNHGTLDVDKCWDRLAIDVTHYKNKTFLTVIDCGPSRFAIWKPIAAENRQSIIKSLSQIFREFGSPKELLLDNSPVFTSTDFKVFCKEWKISLNYRCAYHPEGNGIIERNHRTIKRMSARTQQDPEEIVYWYNNTPKHGQDVTTIPSRQIFSYERPVLTGIEMETLVSEDGETRYEVGDVVFVRPPNPSCTSMWTTGRVTKILSNQKYEIDGVPRHVSHLRLRREEIE